MRLISRNILKSNTIDDSAFTPDLNRKTFSNSMIRSNSRISKRGAALSTLNGRGTGIYTAGEQEMVMNLDLRHQA